MGLGTWALSAVPVPIEIHVSAGAALLGSRDGSREAPFATVFEARDAMRVGLGAGAQRTVFIDGDHHLPEPLILDQRDAGTAEAPIVWRSRSFAKPARLTGGKKLPVTAFTPATVPSGAAGVVKAELYSAAIGLNSSIVPGMASPYPFDDLELFYEGQPMTRARSPNIAPDGTWMWSGYTNVTTVNDMSFEFLDSEKADLWAPAAAKGDLWLHGFFKFDWRDTFIRIASITKNSQGFNVTRDSATKPQYPFTKGCRFYAVAALELLDVPGEYHVDKKTGTLHFLPPTPLTPGSDLLVSVLNTVVQADTSHTKFQGLTMSVSRDDIFSTTNRAATTVGNNVTVEDCVVSNAGGSCVHLQGSNNTARNNTIFGCGTSGIAVISGNVKTLERGNSAAIGNEISQCSRIQRTCESPLLRDSIPAGTSAQQV